MDFTGKHILFVDFETFYDSKAGYDLKGLSITEYIRDSRFKVHGVAVCHADEQAKWLSDSELRQEIVYWPNTVVVAHNVKFDGAILAWKYGIKPYAWCDTVALAKAVLGERVSGYSLGQLAQHLGLKSKGTLKWDGARDLTAEQDAEMAEYCKTDVEICRGIYEKLMPQFPTSQMASLDWTIRCFVDPRLVLNLRVLEEGVTNEKKRREEAIQKSGIDKKILSSNKQFAEYLRSINVTVPTKVSARTGKSIPAFARTDNGLALIGKEHPVLYNARLASKANLLETRGDALIAVGKTGTFPFDVGFSGAVQTHRYSGGSGAGGNPQNFTRGSFLRTAIASPTGTNLIVGDFAAIELRLLAWLAKEPKLINKLLKEEDVYSDFASIKYGRVITKEDKVERHFGKCAILGLGYQMGGDKFATTVKTQTGMEVNGDDAWSTVNLYRETYFNIPRIWEVAQQLIPLIASGGIGCLSFAPFIKVRKEALVLPSGLTIQYPNLRSVKEYSGGKPRVKWYYDKFKNKTESERVGLYGGKIIENICQALAGELCKEAIERIEMGGIACVGQVHDEIIAISKYESDAHRVKAYMEIPPKWLPEMRLKAEVGFGPNWAEAKK